MLDNKTRIGEKRKRLRIASLMIKISGKSTSIIYFTHRINKTTLCSGKHAVDHDREGVCNSIDRQIKTSIGTILQRSSSNVHFAVEFEVMYNIFPFREDLIEKR